MTLVQRLTGRMPTALLMLVCVVVLAAATATGATVETAYSPQLGTYLVDSEGMTLYLYTKDEENKSNCYDSCAENWPPLTVSSASELELPDNLSGTLGTTERTDGTLQVTYNGMPLYYWVRDQKPGDTTGHDVGEVWYVVNPAPTLRVAEDDELGKYLVDATGMTVYLYTKDEQNKTNCYDSCAENWPPIIVSHGEPVAGEGVDQSAITLVTRDDGSQQVAYKGMPLYLWVRDQAPGDTTGQGVGEVWYVVEP